MFQSLMSVDPITVVIALVVYMALGFAWYGPLFGEPWRKLMGISKKDMAPEKMKGMEKIMALNAVASLVTVIVIGGFIQMLGVSTVFEALVFGFLAWFGFEGASEYSNSLFTKKNKQLVALDTSYRLVGYVLVAVTFVLF